MLRAFMIVVAVTGATLILGCDQQGTPTEGEVPAETREKEIGETKGKKQDKGGEPEEWAAKTKKEVIQLAQEQVQALRKGIGDLDRLAAQKGEAAREKWNNDLQPGLEERLGKSEEELGRLKEKSGETWNEVKTQIQESIVRLEDAYAAAKKELQKEEGEEGKGNEE